MENYSKDLHSVFGAKIEVIAARRRILASWRLPIMDNCFHFEAQRLLL